jgi:hypothetical protein
MEKPLIDRVDDAQPKALSRLLRALQIVLAIGVGIPFLGVIVGLPIVLIVVGLGMSRFGPRPASNAMIWSVLAIASVFLVGYLAAFAWAIQRKWRGRR